MLTLGAAAASAGYRLAAFDSIGSTNAEALRRARAGETGPIWFATTEQTAGKGRRQRVWIAPRGNLAASVLEVMDVTAPVAATLGFVAGLSVHAALCALAPAMAERFRLKWPNDVLAEGRKLTGILLEAESLGEGRLAVVAGIGTNVVAAPEGTPFPATSLSALGLAVTAETLFAALSDAWAHYRALWDGGRGFDAIRREWLAHARGVGEPVSVRSGETVVEGVFETIDPQGCLMLRGQDGRLRAIAAGDVYFGAVASAGAA